MKVSRLAKHECGDDDNGVGFDEVVYYVRGDASFGNVLTAVDSDDPTIKIPARGDAHHDDDPENPTHFCTSRSASWLGQNLAGENQYIVTCRFKTRGSSNSGDYASEYEYEWDVRYETVSDPTDIDGNVVVNAAGDPIDADVEKTVPVIILRVLKRRDLFDASLAKTIVGAVNSEAISLFGALTAEAGQLKLESYRPLRSFTYGSTPTPGESELVFEIKWGHRPWDAHFANVGFNGWYEPTEGETAVKGPFIHGPTGKKSLLDVPVLIGPRGIPVGSDGITVAHTANGRVVASHLAAPNPNEHLILDPEYHPTPSDPANPNVGYMEFRRASETAISFEAVAKLKKRYDFVDFLPFFQAAA